MAEDLRTVLRDARLLLEQERAWDDYVLADPPPPAASSPSSSSAAASRGPTSGADMDPPLKTAEDDGKTLAALYERYKDCVACPLGNTRIKFVFGVGNPGAQVMFIGEGPGYEEDRRGEPFVGKAGQLLDKILAAIQLDRTKVYIANIVKCHPMANPETPEARGNDRAPSTFEAETCAPILKQQIAIIQPRVIVTLGSPSTRMILQTMEGITKLRGRLVPFPVDKHYGAETTAAPALFGDDGNSKPAVALSPEQRVALQTIQVLPTYHPAALLRNPHLKKDAWEDMKLLRDSLVPRF